MASWPITVMGFLLQHRLQGWCPSLTIYRRRGVRPRPEIDLERSARKLQRGDLGNVEVHHVDELLDRAAAR